MIVLLISVMFFYIRLKKEMSNEGEALYYIAIRWKIRCLANSSKNRDTKLYQLVLLYQKTYSFFFYSFWSKALHERLK